MTCLRCDKPATERGFCKSHYLKAYRAGELTPKYRWGERKVCHVPCCSEIAVARGWCRSHWRAWKLYGDPTRVKKQNVYLVCREPGCDKDPKARGLCKAHYEAWRRLRLSILATTKAKGPTSSYPLASVQGFISHLESLGLSRIEIADRSGLTPRTIERIVSGAQRSVSAATADRLATAFGRHPDEVFSEGVSRGAGRVSGVVVGA